MNKGTSMTEKRAKTALMLIGEALVIWYGMGTPIPTNRTDGIKILVALLAVIYTGWKNHDFTPEGCVGTGITRQLKIEKNKDYIGEVFFDDVDAEEEETDEQDDI